MGSLVSILVVNVVLVMSCCSPCTNNSLVIDVDPGMAFVTVTRSNISRSIPAIFRATCPSSTRLSVIESMRTVASFRALRIMVGAGYKLFATGDVLTAAQVNTYLMQQTTMVFASSAARTTALSGVVAEGMLSYLSDTNTLQYYDGAAWQDVSNPGDITGVTAGTGLSGGGTSGAVTVSLDTASIYVVPAQAGQSGKYLTTNGTASSWGTVDALPSQTSNAGKYLTTNGTSPSWAAIVTDPTPSIFMLMGA